MHTADSGNNIMLLGTGGLGAHALNDGWDTALDIFSKVGAAAGSFVQGRAADAALQNRGESAFVAMKSAAEAAQWPPTLGPLVVSLDKEWQQMKTKPLTAADVDNIVLRMQNVTAQLTSGAGAGTPKPGDVAVALALMQQQAKKKSTRTVLYVAGALAAAGVGYALWSRSRPRPTPIAVSGYFGYSRPHRRRRRRAALGCGCGA